MTPNRMIAVSILVLLLNGTLLTPDDACAGSGCHDDVICLMENCDQYSDSELDAYCATTTGGISGCCTVWWRCRDNILGCSNGRLFCHNQRPCP